MDYSIGAVIGQMVGGGFVEFDPTSEDSPDGILSYNGTTDRLAIPAGVTLTALGLVLFWGTPTVNTSTSTILVQAVDDNAILLNLQAGHPPGSTFLNDEPGEDFIVLVGSWPFTAPEACYLRAALTMGGGESYDLEAPSFLEIEFTPTARPRRWWAGVAGWG